jgi:hypothetical protein
VNEKGSTDYAVENPAFRLLGERGSTVYGQRCPPFITTFHATDLHVFVSNNSRYINSEIASRDTANPTALDLT